MDAACPAPGRSRAFTVAVGREGGREGRREGGREGGRNLMVTPYYLFLPPTSLSPSFPQREGGREGGRGREI